MRILITEEALETGKGHWPSYIGDLAAGFRAAGDEVTVLTHRRASAAVLERVGGTPWYSRNCWLDRRSQGKVGGLLHNWHFYRETVKHLRAARPYDRVLALTMRLQHLLAFAALVRSSAIPASTRFVLLFVQGFGVYAGPGRVTVFPGGVATRLARAAFRRMAPAVKAGRVVLAAETGGMRDELKRFTGLPAVLFPHPVHLPGEDDQTGSAETMESGVLTVTCPGFARHEKGSDLLQEAILRILDGPLRRRFRFILQWPEPFDLPDGRNLAPDPRLVSDQQVEWRNESLDVEAYAALLRRSDFVILPYRAGSYHQRLSRVAIEAAGAGIPLIYSADTWTGEVAALTGAGVRIAVESAEQIVTALVEVSERAEELKETARRHARKVREFHSTAMFRKLLVEEFSG